MWFLLLFGQAGCACVAVSPQVKLWCCRWGLAEWQHWCSHGVCHGNLALSRQCESCQRGACWWGVSPSILLGAVFASPSVGSLVSCILSLFPMTCCHALVKPIFPVAFWETVNKSFRPSLSENVLLYSCCWGSLCSDVQSFYRCLFYKSLDPFSLRCHGISHCPRGSVPAHSDSVCKSEAEKLHSLHPDKKNFFGHGGWWWIIIRSSKTSITWMLDSWIVRHPFSVFFINLWAFLLAC